MDNDGWNARAYRSCRTGFWFGRLPNPQKFQESNVMEKIRFQKWPVTRAAVIFFAVGILVSDCVVLGEEAGPYTVAKEIKARAEFNPVFRGESVSLPDDEVFFVAEIPRGEVRKFEMRTATGQVIVDRTLCPRLVPGTQRRVDAVPATYGFSAGRFNVDGDPLDLVVLGREDLYSRMIRANRVTPQRVRIVGILRMEECEETPCMEEDWENDWKILAVDPADPEFRDTRDVSELSEGRLDEFVEFWSNYKGLSGGHPQTRVRGTADRKAALAMRNRSEVSSRRDRQKEVSRCDSHADELLERRVKILSQSAPPPDEKFVECLGRVFSPAFFKTQENYDFLIQYGAYQLLKLKLKAQEVTLPDALARMQELREGRETHYRFVATDAPLPGSGNLIFEWVKTKERNQGCGPDFPSQHYESQPISPSWGQLVSATGPLALKNSMDDQ